ncbi:MAG TPA: SRPBCC family protein [Ktedonobacterales bacterium]
MASNVRSVESSANPGTIWRIWSDVSPWPTWNTNVSAMSLNGPLATGATGTMTNKAGRTHSVAITEVQPGSSFRLETTPIPMTPFAFDCTVAPREGGGSVISQGVTMKGPLGGLLTRVMGPQVAESFLPLLRGLAARAEAGS